MTKEEIQKASVEYAEKIDKKYAYKNTELPYVIAIEAFKEGAEYTENHPTKNENINLAEILKGHEDEEFYNPLFGNIKLSYIGDNYIVFSYNLDCAELFIKHNGNSKDTDELAVFPSKYQRDWNKWVEEQKAEAPKIWSEYVKIIPPETTNNYKDYPFAINNPVFKRKDVTPTEKAALAFIKIYQLIEVGYGGNVINKDWNDPKIDKFIIIPDINSNGNITWNITSVYYYISKTASAFYSKEYAQEFLSYPENVELLKDYFMI